jgi:pyruvate formate lyase activating enzyme
MTMIPVVGVQKTSLIDYPGKLATILFTPGCNFRCPYCHNPQLVAGEAEVGKIPFQEIREHLVKRKKLLDGVVITGGEPTLHGEKLVSLLQDIKELGYLVKLDTNGTKPDLLQSLIEKQLVDYVAMDIKTSISHYRELTGVSVDLEDIKASIALLLSKAEDCSALQVEFRTTLHPALHTIERFQEMVMMIDGAPLYVLQTFRPLLTLNPLYQETHPFTDVQMQSFMQLGQQHVKKCVLR